MIGDGDDGANQYREEDDQDEEDQLEEVSKQKSSANKAATMSHDDL